MYMIIDNLNRKIRRSQKRLNIIIVTGLLLKGRSPEDSESVRNASHAARCLREVQVSDTNRFRKS